MKLLTWNINHRVNVDPHKMAKGLLLLDPDVIVLTEYRPGLSHKSIESRRVFLEDLKLSGFSEPIISQGPKDENLIFITAKTHLVEGEIKAQVITVTTKTGKNQETTALPSNVLHVKAPERGFDILGIRIPDYSEKDRLRRACWDWLLETTAKIRDKPFVILGDFNADPDSKMSPAYYCTCMKKMETDGWKDAQPETGSSYVTHRGGWEKRLDHIFLSGHFTCNSARFIPEDGGFVFTGNKDEAMSDHAVLVVDAELKK